MNSDFRQQDLFERDPPPWERDDAQTQRVARVVLLTGPEDPLDYSVGPSHAALLQPGMRVDVPLGRRDRPARGYCVEVATIVADRPLKPVLRVVDAQPLLSPAMLRLTQWLSDHYLCPWARVLEAVVPAGVREQAGTRSQTLLSVPPPVLDRLGELKLPRKQLQALTYLAHSDRPLTAAQLALAVKCTAAPIRALREQNLVVAQTKRLRVEELREPPAVREENLTLFPAQQQALDSILDAVRLGEHQTLLLHGITGSGKTEVYIRAIQEVVSYGRQAIVLVPEISLTPQTRARFRARFGQVAVLHSHLTDAERHWHWQQIAAGHVNVVVGARSAVFAPVPHLGLVVLDEEHEASFKQDSAPRYHARDVALYRARTERVPLVLGSATPSLESWRRAESGEFRLLELPVRVQERPLPVVSTVDLCYAGKREHAAAGAISEPLARAMDEALASGGQTILLLNRRGFSTHIQCPACGHSLRCPHCDITLTYHKHGQFALCHYCDHEAPAPRVCEACGFGGLRFGGLGTQKLEAEVHSRFPDYPCLRMDADSMQGHGAHERALQAFAAGEVRILLGTQMIAKGLDFPNVTLVGVINADTALHLPDFRAAERTFQLLVQVAGRTGRGTQGGRVLVQTFCPGDPTIQAAVQHDYAGFAQSELAARKALCYPPFGALLRLVIRGPQEQTTLAAADDLARRCRAALSEVQPGPIRVLGPAPAPLPRLRGRYRFQVQLQAPQSEQLTQAVRRATQGWQLPDEVQWIADVDPLDML